MASQGSTISKHTTMNTAALAALPPEKMRMGSGLITIVQQGIGGTMSIAGGALGDSYDSAFWC